MASLRRIKLNGLNAHITCTLCQGYYVEATTIIECLHTFCRTCIVRYLESSTFCPVCEVQVHKTKPLLSLREDKTLQDVVYKLVPNLYRSEMQRRTEFYEEHPEAAGDRTEQSLREKRHFFHVDDHVSLSLEFLPPAHAHAHALGLRPLRGPTLLDQNDSTEKKGINDSAAEPKVPHKRYIKCQAAVQIRLLEKFVRLKYALSDAHRVDIVHGSDCLSPELTLLDVVYTYKYAEDCPLNLQYTVIAPPPILKRRKQKQSSRTIECNGDSSCNQFKKQRLENTTDSLENKKRQEYEVNTNDFEQHSNRSPSSHTACLKTKLGHDTLMDVDEAPVETSKEAGASAKSELNKTPMKTPESSECKGKPHSSIESLRKFVNNAPGLSGFQSDCPASVPSTIDQMGNQLDNTSSSEVSATTSVTSNTIAIATVHKAESECLVTSTNVDAPIVARPTLNPTHPTAVVNCSVRPSAMPHRSPQTSAVRQPHLSNPRVILHRPQNVGFPHANNLVRYNSVMSTPRPVDPTKPRLGRPPNAARVAAAAAGRAMPQPILPRGPPTRIQFKQMAPNKIENRGRPKKKPLIMATQSPVINNSPVSTAVRQNNPLQSCMPINGNITVPSVATSNSNQVTQHQSIAPIPKPISTSPISSTVSTKCNSVLGSTISNVTKPSTLSPKPNGVGARPISIPNKLNKSVTNKPTGSASRLSSITDSLFSKQLSQLGAPKNAPENTNSSPVAMPLPTASMPVSVQQSVLPQMVPNIPFIPGVTPALCAAAYMSEYNNVSQWLQLSQTAAAIGDINCLQALANQRNSPPSKSDIKPMDLSPTNKNGLNGAVPSSRHSSTAGQTNSLSHLPSSLTTSQASPTDLLTKPMNNTVSQKGKISEKESNHLERLINSKFSNNNNITVPSNLLNHGKNALENFAKSMSTLSNKVDNALNNSPIKKCTSTNPKICMNQVPLKVSGIVPRKNGMTTHAKSNSRDKNSYNAVSMNSLQSAVKGTKLGHDKVANEASCLTQRSSPIPAIAPSPRSRLEGLHSVPSPKAAQSASPNSPSIPSTTISPPTAEVTITKLPNSSAPSSVSYVIPVACSQTSSAAKITHTNTVSITKRPTSASISSVASKLAIRSPSASVRQIPNPSLLSQKSEVRNIKNVRVDN